MCYISHWVSFVIKLYILSNIQIYRLNNEVVQQDREISQSTSTVSSEQAHQLMQQKSGLARLK